MMSIELTLCPGCKLFVSLRGYDHHIMRCQPDPVEHATLCTKGGETLFGDETCESVDRPFAKPTSQKRED